MHMLSLLTLTVPFQKAVVIFPDYHREQDVSKNIFQFS